MSALSSEISSSEDESFVGTLLPTHPTALRLLDVTVEAIDRDGEASVRVQEVVRAAGVQIPVLYRHFGSREGLIQAAHVRRLQADIEFAIGTVGVQLAEATTKRQFLVAFEAILDDFFSPGRAERRIRRLNVLGSSYGRPELQRVVSQLLQQMVTRFVAVLRPAQQKGWISPTVELDEAALWVFGVVLGRAMVELEGADYDIGGWDRIARRAILATFFVDD